MVKVVDKLGWAGSAETGMDAWLTLTHNQGFLGDNRKRGSRRFKVPTESHHEKHVFSSLYKEVMPSLYIPVL